MAGGNDSRDPGWSGWGTMDGHPVYYEQSPDGQLTLFPEGLPRGQHDQMPHEKMIVNPDGGVEYWRRHDGTIINKYRG